MIYYMAKNPDGKLYPRTISETWFNPRVPGWTVVPIEIREIDEKRKRPNVLKIVYRKGGG